MLVKGWLGRQQWGLPGGGIHRRENTILSAIREVHEETGISVRKADMAFVGSFYSHRQYGVRYAYELFYVRLSHRPDVVVEGREIIDYQWVPQQELVLKNNIDITTTNIIRILELKTKF
ncbi:MAG: hypothetical protein NVSMB46_04370 [Candidatus Saccharimonadales bacterium]